MSEFRVFGTRTINFELVVEGTDREQALARARVTIERPDTVRAAGHDWLVSYWSDEPGELEVDL